MSYALDPAACQRTGDRGRERGEQDAHDLREARLAAWEQVDSLYCYADEADVSALTFDEWTAWAHEFAALRERFLFATKLRRREQWDPMTKPATMRKPAISSDDLRAMMRDPRYWRERDPVFCRRVTDGFRALVDATP